MTRQANIFETRGSLARTIGAVGLFLLVAAILTACAKGPTTYTEADEVAIYAAVVRQIYTKDDTFGGNLKPPTLYILTTTDDSVGDPNIEKAEARSMSEPIKAGIEQALADLPTRIVWVSDLGELPEDPTTKAVADGGAFVSLGNIHFQKDGSAFVSGGIYIAPLAAGGQTYVVERVEGAWQVTGTTGVVWMS